MIKVRWKLREDNRFAINVYDATDLEAGYPLSECIIELITVANRNEAIDFMQKFELADIQDEWEYEEWRRNGQII